MIRHVTRNPNVTVVRWVLGSFQGWVPGQEPVQKTIEVAEVQRKLPGFC
jgi:hypothetical protein